MSEKIRHLAIIMDGNGRWARMRGLPRNAGHKEGLKTVEKVIDWAKTAGIDYLSLFVFSTENWKRPEKEVDGIFDLAEKYVGKFEKFAKDNVRVVVSGDVSRLKPTLVTKIRNIVSQTANFDSICVNLCINYGGRQDVSRAAARLAEAGKAIDADSLREELGNLPDPDMILRTGGQMRLSNFLLFEGAYAELYFSDTLWPDFSKEEFDEVLSTYAKRTRNFGALVE